MADPSQIPVINSVLDYLQRQDQDAALRSRWYGPAIPQDYVPSPNYDPQRLPGYVGDMPADMRDPQFGTQQISRQPSVVENIIKRVRNFTGDLPYDPTGLAGGMPLQVMYKQSDFPRVLGSTLGRTRTLSKSLPKDVEKANIVRNIYEAMDPEHYRAEMAIFRDIPNHPTWYGYHLADPDPVTGDIAQKVRIVNTRGQTAANMFNTLGHEYQHVDQSIADPTGMPTSYISSDSEDMIKQIWQNMGKSDPPPEHLTYRGQRWEKEAFDQGAKAEDMFNQFTEGFGRYNVNRPPSQVPDFVEKVILPSMKRREAAISALMKKHANDPEMMWKLERVKAWLNNDAEYLTNSLNPAPGRRVPFVSEFLPSLDYLGPEYSKLFIGHPLGAGRILRDFLLEQGNYGNIGTTPLQIMRGGRMEHLGVPRNIEVSDIINKLLGRPLR